MAVTEQGFLELGLGRRGLTRWKKFKRETQLSLFRAYYGATPKTCESIWNDIGNDKPIGFLIALRWLRRYETEQVLAYEFDNSEKDVRETVRELVGKIAALKMQKVSGRISARDAKR